MGKMDELDAAIGEMTKKLEDIDDKDKVQELRESMKMVKQQAKDDPEKIDELIASMKMMSTSIDDPSAMFAGMGGGGGGGGQTIKVEIVDHFAETNAAIREAKQTNDIDTLERVLKERAEHKSPLYFDAEKTLMAWKQKRCKDAMLEAIEEKDVETLKAELEIAARPDVFLTGTNSKGQPYSDAVVIRAKEVVAMSSMADEEASDWFIREEMEKRKQYGVNGELTPSMIKLLLTDFRITVKTPFYYKLEKEATQGEYLYELEGLIRNGREYQALEELDSGDMAEAGLTEDDPRIIEMRQRLKDKGYGDGTPGAAEEEGEEGEEVEEEKKKDGFVASTAKKEAKKQKGFVEKLIRRDLAKVIRYPAKLFGKQVKQMNKAVKSKVKGFMG